MANVVGSWEEVLETPAAPEWLTDFDHDAYAAVDAALWQAYYFGNLNVAEPADLLTDWALGIGERNDFVTRLDLVLAQWIQRNWGRQPEAQGTRSAAALAHAWMQLTQVIANVPALIQAPQALRAYFADCQAYLGPLCEGFSRDPLASFLLAVARHQEDRSLLPVWWNYCDLAPGIPWHHGSYGVLGLRGLPTEERGGFPEHVAYGLLRLGLGLHKRSLDQSLEPHRAEAEFQRAARLTLRAYPFPARWRECWANQLYALRRRDEPVDGIEGWLSKLVPGLEHTKTDKQHSSFSLPPNMAGEAGRIAGRLRSKALDATAEAQRLLGQQRRYAEKTGDSYFVCRTLNSFATAVSDDNPQLALEWAEESRVWEPWDPYTWSELTRVLRRNQKIDEALDIAWAAIDRFPDNVFARTGLAEVLRAAGEFAEAEAVYRDTIHRFPDNVFARNGLAEVLRAAEKLAEAEAVYRDTIDRFPHNVVARNGLAEVLRAAEKLTEAEAVYRDTIDRFPHNVVARNGLAEVLKAAGKLAEAEAVYRETIERFRDDVVARNGLAYLLKETNRLHQSEAVFRETLARFPKNAYALIGLSSVLRLTRKDDLTEAFDLIEQARSIAPSDAEVLLEQARLCEAVGRMEEAEAILQQAHALSAASAAKGLMERMAETDAGSFAESVGPPESAEPDTLAAESVMTTEESDVERGGAELAASPEGSEKGKGGARVVVSQNRVLVSFAAKLYELCLKYVASFRAKLAKVIVDLLAKAGYSTGQSTGRPQVTLPEAGSGGAVPTGDSLSDQQEKIRSTEVPIEAERQLHPRITGMQAKAISAHARFLRHWARQNDTNGTAQPTPAKLRDRAIVLLDQLIQAQPYQTNARAEKAILLLEAGQPAAAKQFLSESIALFYGDTSLRYALVRVEREIARQEKRRLADVTSARVTTEWNRLRSLSPSFLPLEQLGGARTWLSHRDGQEVRTGALKSFSKMRQWMQPHLDFVGANDSLRADDPESVRHCYSAKEGFENWWSREVQAYLFGPVHINEALTEEHLDLISERLERYERPIDILEEDFAVRLSP
jgi:tetratricopeptide (TPR) repeat protein